MVSLLSLNPASGAGNIEDLKAIPIKDIWDKYSGLPLKRKGKELAGRCNRHGTDSDPSLLINTEKNSFFCHGCQKGGDGIKLAEWLLACDFKAVLTRLVQDFQIDVSGPKQPGKKIAATYDYLDLEGKLLYQSVRMDPKDFRQRQPDGKGGWVWNLKGIEPVPYKLPNMLSAMECGETVYIVEGEKDVGNLAALGITATCNSGGAGKWTEVHSKHFLPGTEVVILPDNDSPGQKHATLVAKQLVNRACRVKVLSLPGLVQFHTSKGTGLNNGADVSDWLAMGHSKEELLQLVSKADYWSLDSEPEGGGEIIPADQDRYAEWKALYKKAGFTVDRWGRLCQVKATKDGTEEKPLASFVARILREITRDNGQDEETKIVFEIDGLLPDGRKLPSRLISAAEFPTMNWPLKAWGADALVLAGISTKDALRVAIQSTGRGARRDRLYCHTGWRKIGEKWCYLHAGGAIGSEGVQVDLSEGGLNLERYRLPDTKPDISEVAPVVLKMLEVAPRKVTLPLLALVFLAPMCDLLRRSNCEPTFLVWLYGHTGERKSSLAALFLSFFGNFGRDKLPANFKDSRNMTEKLAFLLKDNLLVVDDFHPVANAKDRTDMTGKAQALLRSYGDRAGRGRMNADTSLKTAYVPRGLALITGEDMADIGESGAARMLSLEIPRGGVALDILSECQEQAANLPGVMRGYLEWLLDKMDAVEDVRKTFIDLRREAQSRGHGRLSEIEAWLIMGMISGMSYLTEIGGITGREREAIVGETWAVIKELAAEQAEAVQMAKPAERFINALREMMTAGAVQVIRVSDFEGGANKDDRRFIGWQDTNFFYLVSGLTYKAVQHYFRDQGIELGVSEITILKHLESEGYIEPSVTRSGKTERTRLKKIEGEPRRVIYLYKSRLQIEREKILRE